MQNMQLVSMSKARKSTDSHAPSFLSANAISQIKEVSSNSKTFFSSSCLKFLLSDLPRTLRGKLKLFRDKTKEFSSRLSTSLRNYGTETHRSDITARLLNAPPSTNTSASRNMWKFFETSPFRQVEKHCRKKSRYWQSSRSEGPESAIICLFSGRFLKHEQK